MLNDEINILLDCWNSCEEDICQHWIAIAEQLDEQLFEEKNDKAVSTAEIIADFRDLFDQMSADVNSSNRRSYCKALFNYCELTQDWRDWGDWTQKEIAKGVGTDAPWLYYGLGRYLEEIGQLQKSIDYHQAGISASEKAGNKMLLACNHLGSGIALQRYNKPDDAEYHLLQALELFKQQNHLYLQAHTLVNLGSCYDRFAQSQKAIARYQQSAAILRKIGNYFDLGRILYSLGIAHLNLNQLKEAEKVFMEAQQLCDNTKNLYFLALTFYGIGWLEYKKSNFRNSQNYLENSLRQLKQAKQSGIAAIQLSFPEIEGNIYVLAAAAYSKGNEPNFEAAEKYLEQAETAYLQLDYADQKLLNVLANKARLYEYSQNWSAAGSEFLKLLAEGKRCKFIKTIADAAIHLVYIYYKKRASLIEWIRLLQKLGLLGLWGLAKGYFERIKLTSH